jgi:tetratricopeptide (TPR) repeat protein
LILKNGQLPGVVAAHFRKALAEITVVNMAIDPYALCPCGSGKKLKFCCSDVVGDIEKIHRMIEGDQPRAALRHVEQTLANHPNRASLLDLKASLELSLDEQDAARRTVDEFMAAHPESPTALACRALFLADTDQATAAAATLQRALALVEREMPQRVFEAIGVVGGALLEAGHVIAAQAYLWLHASIAPKDDTRAYEAIVGLNHYSGLPLLVRDQLRFQPWPENAPWKADAEKASRLADHGKWQEAVGIIDRLGQQYGAEPALVFNRALLGGWLADERSLVAGLHAFAHLDVPLDDAVEAEAIAQLLDPELKESPYDSVLRTYAINDEDELVRRLSSDNRLQRLKMNPATFSQTESIPPRHAFVQFDRPMPESGQNLSNAAVPRLMAIVTIYGRQTDQTERLQLTADKGQAFDATIDTLREIVGDSLGDMVEERIVGHVTPTEQALNWKWQLPRDTPPDVRRRLFADERRTAIVDRWPALPRPALGGKTPREAVGDPELRIPLMAAVLILEHGSGTGRDVAAIAQLRNDLGLPQPEPVDPQNKAVMALRLTRVPRLKVELVSDDDLVQLYRRSLLTAAQAAIACLAEEAVKRPSLASRIPPNEAYQRLIATEPDPDQASAWIAAARERSHSAGESTAQWELAELDLHITSGNTEQARETLARIERDHLDDPQVAAALYQLLYDRGVIRPGQVPVSPEPEEEVLASVASGEEPSGSRIWTPDSDRPAGGKSTLWTPS